MRCLSCETDNAPGTRFCISCGAPFSRSCPYCGHSNPSIARFCAQCGKGVDEVVPLRPAAPTVDGELKQITVMFADISGSTGLIESLHPEAAARRLAPAIEAMQEAVHRFEGSVVRVQGDGVMALFGAPTPQEDHAVRACCAALALQASIRAMPGDPLPIRVGIHSGEVLARTIATDFSMEFDATGVTVHIASRLEELAPAGGIVISAITHRSARPYVTADPLGPKAIRGLSSSLDVFLLTGLRQGPTTQRFGTETDRSDFVGRVHELTVLLRGLERA